MKIHTTDSKKSITKEYKIEKGGSAHLKIGKHLVTGERRAIQTYFKKDFKTENFTNLINIYSQLNHPNIVHVYEFYEDRNHFYVVMDLLTGGELLDQICSKGKFCENEARVIMKQLLSALLLIHSHKIIYK